MLADPATPDETRRFLLLAGEIKEFAVESVGLADNGNYTRYRAIGSDHLVDVVCACDAASFTPYLWRYPILGKLPYKGFYRREDADREAARRATEGYDVIVRPVDAFSTLGITRDPLYSFMARYSPFELAQLIIHEQTHATVFRKGQPDFNEELATFVGVEGALAWMRMKYGESSEEYRAAIDANEDSSVFSGLLRGLASELDSVYQSTASREEKLARKAETFDAFAARFVRDRSSLFRTDAYRTARPPTINNAVLSQYRLYSSDVPLLRSYWERICGQDLERFVAAVKAMPRRGDVKARMRRELADLPGGG
jgi:predicted aminopeptidase